MTTAAVPDFRLYHSNALDVLAGLLAEELRAPAPGASLLAPDTVLIPQVAMRRWLQATLADRHGVAANLEFLTPGEFVTRALDANLGASGDDLDANALHWRLYAALTDPRVVAQPALAQLAHYLSAASPPDPLKPWSLAGELADVFEKYQAWRRDWLLRWDAGAEPDDPQAMLWRHVATGRGYRARRIQQYLDRFEGDGKPLPQGLPTRVFAFATLNVSPDVLRVIATQARAGTMHFYLPTPTREYWGDLQTLAGRLRAGDADPFARHDAQGSDATQGPDTTFQRKVDSDPGFPPDNPLLQAWGAAGRDFMAVLGSYEVVHPRGEIAAYADPERDTRPTLADGGLSDSLLHRLQRDLFHRRPPPPAVPTGDDRRERLPGLRRYDPSLQLHACHTRLRELQVLHDRLRALLDADSPEGRRFDPPLQPREIAVLAPDIDPYVPYLEAVFGQGSDSTSRGKVDSDPGFSRIPYALADTSPLAGEPLAEVFVRLLDLPVSRFGLGETLDLLASAPIADAAGLDTPALERLHAWLQAAGARWGLDAKHRAALDAPADDAYTWQFALDRLLLGHATGDGGDIVGADGQRVAPWPELEGGSLDALDALLRLLRVLARHQSTLADALPPREWRERLLGLLRALLPVEPTDPASQRALDRLRKLIDDFARHAEVAGYDGTVPADVVRAHFAAKLAEADTRAPLLTGGISFGRMVPMRLLPFRVICVLGLNDGEYPRRDPAAGLSRLTAELGSDQRRHGDRSTRDDDRFLFLQLFAAAQDVFHLSYLGADPRDGSLREPSVLVSELVDVAVHYHADPEAARRDFVVRHPLQPFSPAAFGGDDDPRRFSYRRQWHPAAGLGARRRAALPPWFGDTMAAPAEDGDGALSIDALRRFLVAPAEQFLRQRLGLRLEDIEAAGDDVEPLLAPGGGLARNALQAAVFDALLRGDDDAGIHAALRARGLLPSGPLGRRALAALRNEVAPYARAFAGWRRDEAPDAPRVQVDIDGVSLHGTLAGAYPQGLARLRFGAPNGNGAIRDGLDWLLASAAGLSLPLVQFHEDADAGLGPHRREPIEPAKARAALRQLLALRAQGLREPLPFAPYSGWELFDAAPDIARGLKKAADKWRGSERSWSEGNSDALRLALRGRDPFASEASLREFAALSGLVFGLVTAAEPLAIDLGHVDLPESEDIGDVA